VRKHRSVWPILYAILSIYIML